jgi:DNA polymerase-3 subunit delta'
VGFDHILGQSAAIETLQRALKGGHVHHAYRFEGIEGVGKERTALALAQALLCNGGDVLGCGQCDACRRAGTFADTEPAVPLHPDLVIVARGFYPPETIGGKNELSEISVEQVRRVVLARTAYPPHEGRAQVFIIRDADQLSVSAANAMLKALEEPRPSIHFVLLTARSDKLLDTIRSRSLPVRFAPLSDAVLARLLAERGVDAARIAAIVPLAGGSVAAALLLADAEASARRDALVRDVLAAVDAPDLTAAIELAAALRGERGQLVVDLQAVAAAYLARARDARREPARMELEARRHELVMDAIDAVERNGSTTLVVPALIGSLRAGWQRRPGVKPPIVVQRW